jgi:AcrR family transcriptional regulator
VAPKTRAGGHRQFLTRRLVVAAGRKVVEAEGVDGLTIRRVAAELGATPMALYRHVKDKRELVLALLDDVAEGLPPLPGDQGPPRERLVAAFASIDAYLARHVWVVEILRRGELFAPRAAAIFPWVLDRFGEPGLDDEQATDAYATLWWFVRADGEGRAGQFLAGRADDRLSPSCGVPSTVAASASAVARRWRAPKTTLGRITGPPAPSSAITALSAEISDRNVSSAPHLGTRRSNCFRPCSDLPARALHKGCRARCSTQA